MLIKKYPHAFVALPDGLGTLDEIFETATSLQTYKTHDFPVVLVFRDF